MSNKKELVTKNFRVVRKADKLVFNINFAYQRKKDSLFVCLKLDFIFTILFINLNILEFGKKL